MGSLEDEVARAVLPPFRCRWSSAASRGLPLTVLNMPTNGPANMNHYPLLIEFVRGTRISREPEVVSRLLLLLLSL